MHLFSGEPLEPTVSRAALERESSVSPTQETSVYAAPPPAQRLARLEDEVSRLRADLTEVQQQLAAFRKQFE
jgi:TolA-binding protein